MIEKASAPQHHLTHTPKLLLCYYLEENDPSQEKKMAIGTFTHKNVQKSSNIFKPSMRYAVNTGTNIAKNMAFLNCTLWTVYGSSGIVVKCIAAIFFPKKDSKMRALQFNRHCNQGTDLGISSHLVSSNNRLSKRRI